jgi:hypothetical protein
MPSKRLLTALLCAAVAGIISTVVVYAQHVGPKAAVIGTVTVIGFLFGLAFKLRI